MIHDFSQKLAFSNGINTESDKERIMNALGRACVNVEKTDVETDKTGVDYYAYLKTGVIVKIDAKRREVGVSKFWKGIPELAVETYSVYKSKIGWTFNSASPVDYILYSFEPCDSNNYYFLPFQLLRKAAYDNGREWRNRYGEKPQYSNGWESRCIFVPAPVVIAAINKAMQLSA